MKEMKFDCNITQREANYLSTESIDNLVKERINNNIHEWIEKEIQKILDNRPRYSKRIPEKIYLKYHTVEIIHHPMTCRRVPLEWYHFIQESEIWLKFSFKPLLK